jgi:hypothetical protein
MKPPVHSPYIYIFGYIRICHIEPFPYSWPVWRIHGDGWAVDSVGARRRGGRRFMAARSLANNLRGGPNKAFSDTPQLVYRVYSWVGIVGFN